MESHFNGYIPADVIFEILMWLSVKTLMRFKCVCKHWCTLIGYPTFVNQHFSHKSNPEGLFIRYCVNPGHLNHLKSALYVDDYGGFLNDDEVDHLQMPNRTEYLLGPLRGVFCVVNKCRDRGIALFNPAMRQFRPIPSHGLSDHSNLSVYEYVNGFGLDPLSGDYTVVSTQTLYVLNICVVVSHHVCIYNSGRDSWRYIEDVDLTTTFGFSQIPHSICLDGVQYWRRYRNNVVRDAFILARDKSENFQEIQVPDCVKYKLAIDLVLYGDSIALLASSFRSTDERFSLWVMKEVGCWTKTLSLGRIKVLQWPICSWKSTELVFRTDNDKVPLALYNVSTGILRMIGVRGKEFLSKAVPYQESLVSIKGCILWDTSSHFVKDWSCQNSETDLAI